MHCSKARDHLQLYIDGRLALQQVRVLEAHIATCSACQYELRMLEEVSSAVRSMQFVVEPPDLTHMYHAGAGRQRAAQWVVQSYYGSPAWGCCAEAASSLRARILHAEGWRL